MNKNNKKRTVLDLRCDCKDCEDRTKETYNLEVSCINCGWKGIAKIRKGDKAPLGEECPNCGRTWQLSYGNDPKFKKPNEG